MTVDRLDPIAASVSIEATYRSYLKATFEPRRPDLAQDFDSAISSANSEFQLVNGPFLQATPPYKPGRSLQQMVGNGVLHPGLVALAIPPDRTLYHHQDLAITKAIEGRNLIVATGTGSGKTESFLLPIFDGLVRERDAGTLTAPGVRALLLYPMNALVNDQLKRLRQLLANVPDITFGRYVGDTKQQTKQAEELFKRQHPNERRLPNELLSRDEMQASPPHILITNYAMLEYLLLRPADSAFFDGDTSGRWSYMVLDEAHVYGGAKGAEIGMLLRRVKQRVGRSIHGRPLQCFATSATLGSGVDDYPALVKYAETLFGEPFAWTDNPERQDVVGAVRLHLQRNAGSIRFPATIYAQLRDVLHTEDPIPSWRSVVAANVPEIEGAINWDGDPRQVLARILEHDQRLSDLQASLEKHSISTAEAVTRHFDAGQREMLVALVDLANWARHSDGAPLLPARYHFMLRALEGGYVCLDPEHPVGVSRLSLFRRLSCTACRTAGRDVAMFELASCRRCRAEYVTGRSDTGNTGKFLKQSERLDVPLVLAIHGSTVINDEDEESDEAPTGKKASAPSDGLSAEGDNADAGAPVASSTDAEKSEELCPRCGALGAETKCACGVARLSLHRAKVQEGRPVHCTACGSFNRNGVISRLITGSDSAPAVVASELYQNLPASRERRQREHLGEGRKLLSFADSRQDAAFFAAYMDRTYSRAAQRKLIGDVIKNSDPLDPLRYEDIVAALVKHATKLRFLDGDDSRITREREASAWLHSEVLGFDRRHNIDGTGFAKSVLVFPRSADVPQGLLRMGFDENEAHALLQVLLGTLVEIGAVSAPENVDLTEERFEPRNRPVYCRGSGRDYNVAPWSPAPGRINKRVDYLRRVFDRRGIGADPTEILRKLWEALSAPDSGWEKVLIPESSPKGPVWRVNHRQIAYVPVSEKNRPLQCDRCRRILWWSVAGVCSTMKCEGRVTPLESLDSLRSNHYFKLYESHRAVPMSIEEHTAQWTSEEAAQIQEKFISGQINVLSCSTTFEMGVDVGDVQAVLLRNVPPSPSNYVQRAGRAGRTAEGVALILTFAQRRSHDFTYFAEPRLLIDGFVPAPYVLLENIPISRRHVHAVALAQYFRATNATNAELIAGQFYAGLNGPTADGFRDWLSGRPSALLTALTEALPVELHGPLGITNWAWVDTLFDEDPDDPTAGWLGRATNAFRSDLQGLEELIDDLHNEGKQGGDRLRRIVHTMKREQLLSSLAGKNVLPKYGFPVDVVPLDIVSTGDNMAEKLDLTRDLTLAVSDYAPGNTVVAGKRLWVSAGIVVPKDQGSALRHWSICECGAFRYRLEQDDPVCPVCDSTKTKKHGKYLTPAHGFVGRAVKKGPGEDRPLKNSRTLRVFGNYRGAPPDFAKITGLADAEARTSRQGRITVINSGPADIGYRVCLFCGWAEPALRMVAIAKSKTATPRKAHERPNGRGTCSGTIITGQLGHEFLTDTLELQLPSGLGAPPSGHNVDDAFSSALFALLQSVPTLGIERDDVDGTLNWSASGSAHPTLIIHDAVPGGAGHAHRISARLPELVANAVERLGRCKCDEKASCYSCLRDYRNQFQHDVLTRIDALWILEPLMTIGDSLRSQLQTVRTRQDEDLLHPTCRPIVDELVAKGAGEPEIGWEVIDRHGAFRGQAEAGWPDQRVAIVLDEDPERDSTLRELGWQIVLPETYELSAIRRLLVPD